MTYETYEMTQMSRLLEMRVDHSLTFQPDISDYRQSGIY